jgi:transcriptional regulator with XRE-family HTH domain
VVLPIIEKIHINERLRELRIKSGYTQVQIAEILNIDRSTYSYYEIGKTTPDVTVLITLAKVFNIPIENLLSDEGSQEIVSDSELKTNYIRSKKNSSHIYELSSDERILVRAFRSCSVEGQKKIMAYIKNMLKRKPHNKKQD